MTPKRFVKVRKTLGWTNVYLADLLGCNTTVVWRWSYGKAEIPASIAAWLEMRLVLDSEHPPPDDWRVR